MSHQVICTVKEYIYHAVAITHLITPESLWKKENFTFAMMPSGGQLSNHIKLSNCFFFFSTHTYAYSLVTSQLVGMTSLWSNFIMGLNHLFRVIEGN